ASLHNVYYRKLIESERIKRKLFESFGIRAERLRRIYGGGAVGWRSICLVPEHFRQNFRSRPVAKSENFPQYFSKLAGLLPITNNLTDEHTLKTHLKAF